MLTGSAARDGPAGRPEQQRLDDELRGHMPASGAECVS
jgi:hypothetical protein